MQQHRVLTLGVFMVICAGVSGCVTSPPIQEMSDARQAIAAAEQANAARYAPVLLGDARRFIADANEQIHAESFGLARNSALRARSRAMQALQVSEAAARGAD